MRAARRTGGGVRWSWLVIVVALGVLVFGVAGLFRLRFARGDVYPVYSTLRSDPLGARVLFEGFNAAGVETVRHMRELKRARLPDGTCFVLGVTPRAVGNDGIDDWKAAVDLVERGGRLVVGLTGRESFLQHVKREAEESRKSGRKAEKDDVSEEKMQDAEPVEADSSPAVGGPAEERSVERTKAPPGSATDPGPRLTEWLGVGVAPLPTRAADLPVRRAHLEVGAAEAGAEGWPVELEWGDTIGFAPRHPEWRVLYRVGDRPVMIERSLGRGTVVLVGSSYLFSNEAMALAREPRLLAWMLGGQPRAIFDEGHLGVGEDRGLVLLARRYGLTHAALVLLGVVLLHVWRSRATLLPSGAGGGVGTAVNGAEMAGRDASSGLVNLLRRTLPARELLAACLNEFRQSAEWRRLSPERRERVEEIARTGAGRDPTAVVREIHEILSTRSQP